MVVEHKPLSHFYVELAADNPKPQVLQCIVMVEH